MEKLLDLKSYAKVRRCSGSVLIPVIRLAQEADVNNDKSTWRVRLFDTNTTECDIFVMESNRKHFMKVCSGAGSCASVHINLDLAEVKRYRIVCGYWHEILLVDSTKFAVRLDCSDDIGDLLGGIRSVLWSRNVLQELSGIEGKACLRSILTGPPISSQEAAKMILAASIAHQHGVPTKSYDHSEKLKLLKAPAPTIRQLHPIPDEDVKRILPASHFRQAEGIAEPNGISENVGDVLKSFSKSIDPEEADSLNEDELMDVLTDEAILLGDAIFNGDVKGATYWATLLAKRKSDVFIVYANTLDYRPCKSTRQSRRRTRRHNVDTKEENPYLESPYDSHRMQKAVSVTVSPPPIDQISSMQISPRILPTSTKPLQSNPRPVCFASSAKQTLPVIPPRFSQSPSPVQRVMASSPRRAESQSVKKEPSLSRSKSPYFSQTPRSTFRDTRSVAYRSQSTPYTHEQNRLHSPAFPEDNSTSRMRRSPSPRQPRKSRVGQYEEIEIDTSLRSVNPTWICNTCDSPNLVSVMLCNNCDSRKS